MAQHVPISFPSPGDEVDRVGGVDKVDGVGGFGGSIVAYDHKHCEMLILILVKHVLVIMMVIVIGGCSHITSAKNRGSYTPLPPPSAMVSIWLTPPPPSVSNGQHLAYPPSPPRQPSSAFSRRPYCTTIFDVGFLT